MSETCDSILSEVVERKRVLLKEHKAQQTLVSSALKKWNRLQNSFKAYLSLQAPSFREWAQALCQTAISLAMSYHSQGSESSLSQVLSKGLSYDGYVSMVTGTSLLQCLRQSIAAGSNTATEYLREESHTAKKEAASALESLSLSEKTVNAIIGNLDAGTYVSYVS